MGNKGRGGWGEEEGEGRKERAGGRKEEERAPQRTSPRAPRRLRPALLATQPWERNFDFVIFRTAWCGYLQTE
jgi:hypothetical protein